MKRVKIIMNRDSWNLENMVNQFIRDRVVHDIQFRMTTSGPDIRYGAMVVYEECRNVDEE